MENQSTIIFEVDSDETLVVKDITSELGENGTYFEISGYSGEAISQFIVTLSPFIVPIITGLISKYLGKVIIKVDGIEIEASSTAKAKELLELAYRLRESREKSEEK